VLLRILNVKGDVTCFYGKANLYPGSHGHDSIGAPTFLDGIYSPIGSHLAHLGADSVNRKMSFLQIHSRNSATQRG
jgi:hypothetical protein